MIKGIMFDKDGTLLDYKAFWFKVAENAISILLDRYQIKDISPSEMMESLGAYEGITSIFYYGTYQDFAERMNKRTGLDCITRKEASDAFRDSTACGKILPACDNLEDVLKRLKMLGIKTAVVTSDEPKMTEYCLNILKIRDYMDEVYADNGVNPSKPDPYYIDIFCEKYGLLKSEIMMVGDTPCDIEFAKNGGALAVGVAKERRDKEILKQQADVVLDDVSQIFNVLNKNTD